MEKEFRLSLIVSTNEIELIHLLNQFILFTAKLINKHSCSEKNY